MSWIYEIVGRVVVAVVRRRFGKQLRIAGGGALVAAAITAYVLASRDVEEG